MYCYTILTYILPCAVCKYMYSDTVCIVFTNIKYKNLVLVLDYWMDYSRRLKGVQNDDQSC